MRLTGRAEARSKTVRALPAGAAAARAVPAPRSHPCTSSAARCATCCCGGAPSDLDLVVEAPGASIAARIGRPQAGATIALARHDHTRRRELRHRPRSPGALPQARARCPRWSPHRSARTCCGVTSPSTRSRSRSPGRSEAAAGGAPGARRPRRPRRLRVLHDASFIDDPTRLLRLARYRARLGFELEPAHACARPAPPLEAGALRDASAAPGSATSCGLLAREREPIARARGAARARRSTRRSRPASGSTTRTLPGGPPSCCRRTATVPCWQLALASRGVGEPRLRALLDELGFEAA